MSQSTEQLRADWTDETALAWISGNFRWPGGMIRARAGYVPTEKDLAAIDFLCCEWEFAYEAPQ